MPPPIGKHLAKPPPTNGLSCNIIGNVVAWRLNDPQHNTWSNLGLRVTRVLTKRPRLPRCRWRCFQNHGGQALGQLADLLLDVRRGRKLRQALVRVGLHHFLLGGVVPLTNAPRQLALPGDDRIARLAAALREDVRIGALTTRSGALQRADRFAIRSTWSRSSVCGMWRKSAYAELI